MSGTQPPGWFAAQEDSTDQKTFDARKAALLKEMPELMDGRGQRGRANSFMPYLLVRAVLGDRGDRPINGTFWESPDIWTAQGDPSVTPAIPPDHGGQVKLGQPATVYAHVWNIGFAPLAGVRVEFYWFNPSLGITGANANLIGMARCELAARGMAGSHLLVKCPKPWVPVMENGGHECLVVRVAGVGDGIGNNEWDPWLNRHVGQRNVAVVGAGADINGLILQLNRTRLANTRLQLLQIGPQEGELARRIAAPHVTIAPIATHVLGEIALDGSVTLPAVAAAAPVATAPIAGAAARSAVPAAMLAPVHPLAAGGAPAHPLVHAPGTVAILNPNASLTVAPTATLVAGKAATLNDLLNTVVALHPGAATLPAPGTGKAQVLRVASYNGDQLVGGYTLIVEGA
jgi:hypothetical protein